MKTPFPQALLLWDEDAQGYRWPALRDRSGQLLEPFTSYLESVVARHVEVHAPLKATTSTVQAATYAVLALAEHLLEKGRRLYRIQDVWITELRDELLKSVKANPGSRGSGQAAKRTINTKLTHIYKFIYWCQKNRRLPARTIGWLNCRVRSSLPESESRAARIDLKADHLYPLCFKPVGSGSRQNQGQYWATSQDIEALEDHFWGTLDFRLAERNTLALRIQAITAWRNESVNSLNVDAFSNSALAKQRDNGFCLIRPPKQKNENDKAFSVDWVVVDRIVEYIKTSRQQIIDAAGVGEKFARGRLFIGEDGHPLKDATYGEIMADAFKAIGAPKGSGGHSLRRYRTVEEVRSQIASRQVRGLPIDRETITRAVMDLLGHTTEEAQTAYDHVQARIFHESREAELWRRCTAAEVKRDSTRAQLSMLLAHLPREAMAAMPSHVREALSSARVPHSDATQALGSAALNFA